ncbi:hypothetical protein B6N60_00539 [Richelia sinica FACHB-800]|uniref:Uncharacterized protein n=1 Tax=Richelia sinica FACHB-800 TaxID=1357546 RepID=A0A975T441_9NOST|nr:hypothetical protein B6N60_00539 [Richelia sinica FACHB-800]
MIIFEADYLSIITAPLVKNFFINQSLLIILEKLSSNLPIVKDIFHMIGC